MRTPALLEIFVQLLFLRTKTELVTWDMFFAFLEPRGCFLLLAAEVASLGSRRAFLLLCFYWCLSAFLPKTRRGVFVKHGYW